MRSIAILNQKGGVGKTTTSVNLAAAIAAAGRSVGLVDLDPQAHASLHLGLDELSTQPTMYEALTGDAALAEVWRDAGPKLRVAASHIDLAAAEMELAGVVGRELIFRDRLAAESDPPDYLIVDCPPSLGVLTLNALCAVDEVLLPMQPHFLALHGLSKLLESIDLVRSRLNDGLTLLGVVLCMYESSTRLAREVDRDISTFFASARGQGKPWSSARLFQTRVRRNIRLAEAPSFGQSITDYAPQSNGAIDYRALACEVLATEAAAAPRRAA